MNPLVPAVTDVLIATAVVLNSVLVMAALIMLALTADRQRWLSRLLLIVFVPFIGPVVSLLAARARPVDPAQSAKSDPGPVS